MLARSLTIIVFFTLTTTRPVTLTFNAPPKPSTVLLGAPSRREPTFTDLRPTTYPRFFSIPILRGRF